MTTPPRSASGPADVPGAPPASPSLAASRRAARLSAGYGALVVMTTGLIVLGALVRAHGAGLACPDWPLCFGQLVPEFDIKVAFEWGHRVTAGAVGLIFAGLSMVLLRNPALRSALGRRVGVAAAALAVQVVLGALTVWELLAQWTVTSHLVTGNLFNVLLLLLVLSLRDQARAPAHVAPPAIVRTALWAVAALLLAQLVLGGLVASGYAGLACPEWPTCNGGVWFPAWRGSVGLHLAHRMNGYALALALVGAAWLAREHQPAAHFAKGAAVLGALQIVVGVLNVRLGIPVEVTGLHSLLAAALVLCIAGALHACYNAPGRQELATPTSSRRELAEGTS